MLSTDSICNLWIIANYRPIEGMIDSIQKFTVLWILGFTHLLLHFN